MNLKFILPILFSIIISYLVLLIGYPFLFILAAIILYPIKGKTLFYISFLIGFLTPLSLYLLYPLDLLNRFLFTLSSISNLPYIIILLFYSLLTSSIMLLTSILLFINDSIKIIS